MTLPVNIITGFLGVGKTTTLLHLLAHRPPGERWAVLVNEFGQIGIDQVALGQHADSEVAVQEVAGGCICCAMGLQLSVAIKKLVAQLQPHRLIIEPTGLGHPAGIVDILRREFDQTLELRSVWCVVDPRSADDMQTLHDPVFQDQISLADVLVINKSDLAPADLVEEVVASANNMYPPKTAIVVTRHGQVDISLLEVGRSQLFADSTVVAQPKTSHSVTTLLLPPNKKSPAVLEGQPYRQMGSGMGFVSCGWIFSELDVFDEDALFMYLRELPGVKRLKGVFRVGATEWLFINRIGGELVVSSIAYRRDSRLEIITKEELDWGDIENHLKQSILLVA